MELTPNQKKLTKENQKKLNSKELAKQFNVDQNIVEKYINEIENRKNPKWFYLILIFIPFLFLILLEVGLRVADYGTDYSVFVQMSDKYAGLKVFNPVYPQKFFENTKDVPSVIPDPFSEIKSTNSFRIFVLGGSTAAGWPFSYNASFSHYVKRRLEILYPTVNIEMINMGISAVNSYAIKDLIPDIIDQQPNLVLIYAGHNEYYGALGVGSTESVSNSRWIVNLAISLKDWKTYQLISNIIKSVKGISSEENNRGGETLMSQMVKEDLIEYESDLYNAGVVQFNENMDDILNKLSNAGINVIIGDLASNLKQKPFESIDNESESAALHFTRAEEFLSQEKFDEAKSEFISAKEKDALRFRAPEKLNETILDLSKKYKIPVAEINLALSSKSDGKIIGYNLMVDHLHPSVEGHQIIGDVFFNEMIKNSYLPKQSAVDAEVSQIEELTLSTLAYTRVDSAYAEITLSKLLNAYPFVKEGESKNKRFEYKLENYSDSLAEKVVQGKISWEEGHLKAAEYFLKQKNYDKFINEFMALIDDRPFIRSNYTFAVDKLTESKQLDKALPILLKMNKKFPGFYPARRLGDIAYARRLYPRAIYFYESALKFDQSNARVYFNLSGAYVYTKQFDKAINALEKSLKLNPNFPGAKQTLDQLRMMKKQK